MAEPSTIGVVVLVVDPETDEVIRRHEVDYHKFGSREFLRRLNVWAFTNDLIVETFSMKLDKKHKLSEDYLLTTSHNRPNK